MSNRDLGYIDTAGLAMLALGALLCITAYGIACAIGWCWRYVLDVALGVAVGVPIWLWPLAWAERIA